RVIEIQRESIEHYGGSLGIRDMGLLESATAQPRATFAGHYLHEDFPGMAAAYLFHLAMNHPFVDGNKRVAAMAAFVFFDMNDQDFDATEKEYQDLVLDVSAGKLDKAAVTEFFRKHVK